MRIAILHPVLPPKVDGVGDHTARLAAELSRSHDVTVFGRAPADPASFPGVDLVLTDEPFPSGARDLLTAVAGAAPDWLLVQYTGFTYGRTGVNAQLLRGLRTVKKNGTRVGLLAHEAFVPPRTAKLAVLWAAQATQFLVLGRMSDRVLVTTEGWRHRFARWFGADRVSFMRIGSTLPVSPLDRTTARAELDISADSTVCVVFGGLGAQRDATVLRAGLSAVSECPDPVALYVGPDSSDFVAATNGLLLTVRALGTLPGPAVSTALRSADVALAPFIGGVSPRNSSFLAYLQHGLPTVTTRGPLTGPALTRAVADGVFEVAPLGNADAFAERTRRLLFDPVLRAEMSSRACEYYDRNHAWAVVSADVLGPLAALPPRTRP